MQSETRTLDDVTAKLIACAVIVACLALGAIGLLLPLIPGLLFLAVAATVAAKLSPAFESTSAPQRYARRLPRPDQRFSRAAARPDDSRRVPAGREDARRRVALLVAGVMKLVKAAERV